MYLGLIDMNVLTKNIFVYILACLIVVLGFNIIDKLIKIDEKE